VAKVDLVISLIPYTHHATVIKSAIRKKKDVVTTSYVSPAMMELDAQVKEAGITVMNEIGVDPGVDHLSAVLTIDEVHKAGVLRRTSGTRKLGQPTGLQVLMELSGCVTRTEKPSQLLPGWPG
jgi:saccharopine dehydrogenase-like NADP-dependent oxidoreductase